MITILNSKYPYAVGMGVKKTNSESRSMYECIVESLGISKLKTVLQSF
jgi:hypothetical protein